MHAKIKTTERYSTVVLPFVLAFMDYAAILSAEELAFLLRKYIIWHGAALHISWLNFWIAFPVIFILFLHMERLYTSRAQFWQIVQRIFHAVCYATVAIILELYVVQIAASTSRLFIVLLWLFSFLLITLYRWVFKNILRSVTFLQVPVLIIGAGKTAEALVKGIEGSVGFGYRIMGFLEDGKVTSKVLKPYPVLGKFADAEAVIAKTGVQHVIIAAPGMEQEKLTSLIYKVQPMVKNLGIIPNLVSIPMGGLEVESLFNEHLMILRVKNNLARWINRCEKVIFDYVLTIIGVILISPILLFISLWIYKDSPGPVLFKHIRIGKDGKSFPCYKFRTMCVDAKEKLEKLLENDHVAREEWKRDFKLKNDPRITKSGAFLRKTSLDELPQLLNVLRGEMSLVGPRPVVKEELPRYGEYLSDYLLVKPGITGMWQVSGRSDTTYEERVQMDSWYVRNWSVWLDIMLLWRTVKAVVKKEGAY